ncbi:MAG: hypothetical protein JNK05_34760 [Myxococcales bacterium]|nr:hypothetical protein [Myxococcales bacterium]
MSTTARKELTQSTLRRSLVTRAESSLASLHDQPAESPTIEARALAALLRWHDAEPGTWENARATAAMCEIAEEAKATR